VVPRNVRGPAQQAGMGRHRHYDALCHRIRQAHAIRGWDEKTHKIRDHSAVSLAADLSGWAGIALLCTAQKPGRELKQATSVANRQPDRDDLQSRLPPSVPRALWAALFLENFLVHF